MSKKKKPPAKADKGKRTLTPKQAAFIREYLVDKNGTQAAIRAGYSEDPASAAQQAYENLRKPEIKEAIRKQISAQYDRLDITAERILHELMLLATVDIADAYDDQGRLLQVTDMPEHVRRAIAGVEVMREVKVKPYGGSEDDEPEDGEAEVTTKIKLIDKKGALELLAKNLKLLTDKLEVAGVVATTTTVIDEKQFKELRDKFNDEY